VSNLNLEPSSFLSQFCGFSLHQSVPLKSLMFGISSLSSVDDVAGSMVVGMMVMVGG